MAKFTPGRVCSCLGRRRSRNIGFFHPKISAKTAEIEGGKQNYQVQPDLLVGLTLPKVLGVVHSHKDKRDQVELVWLFVIVTPAMNPELPSREEDTVHP